MVTVKYMELNDQYLLVMILLMMMLLCQGGEMVVQDGW